MKTIRQTATIRGATPHDLYETIMDSKKHTKLSSAANNGEPQGGRCLQSGSRSLGQTARAHQGQEDRADVACEQLAERDYSKATFALARSAGGTRVTFTQTGVPDEFYGEISKGWRDYY